jgi:hypothetical protein
LFSLRFCFQEIEILKEKKHAFEEILSINRAWSKISERSEFLKLRKEAVLYQHTAQNFLFPIFSMLFIDRCDKKISALAGNSTILFFMTIILSAFGKKSSSSRAVRF